MDQERYEQYFQRALGTTGNYCWYWAIEDHRSGCLVAEGVVLSDGLDGLGAALELARMKIRELEMQKVSPQRINV
jgi:hypothetical protein